MNYNVLGHTEVKQRSHRSRPHTHRDKVKVNPESHARDNKNSKIADTNK